MAFTWRYYTGNIPYGAVSAGLDNNKHVYVGRVTVEDSTYVGVLRDGIVELKICRHGIKTFSESLEILCSNIDLVYFQWVPNGTPSTGSSRMVGTIEDLGEVEIVRTITNRGILVGQKTKGFIPYVAEDDKEINPTIYDVLYCRALEEKFTNDVFSRM